MTPSKSPWSIFGVADELDADPYLVDAHRPDKHTPMEEVVRGFNHLIHTGQALYWGTSEWSSEEIMDAWRIADKLSKSTRHVASRHFPHS